jgi:hypothetical protein
MMEAMPRRPFLRFQSTRVIDALGICALSILFRVPVLANASGLNSDVAIVGLQARHMLALEFHPLLWGSGYQSSVDSAIAAVFFAGLGAQPWVLIASALALHLALTLAVHDVLLRVLGEKGDARFRAFALACLLVFTTASVHSFALNPPREAALLLAFFALASASKIAISPKPFHKIYASCAFSGLACYADPYAILLYPVWALGLTLEVCATRGFERNLRSFARVVAASGVGLLPYLLLRSSTGATAGKTSLRLEVFPHNLALLLNVCGPWWSGLSTYAAQDAMDYTLWHPPTAIRYGAGLGTAALAALFLGALFVVAAAARAHGRGCIRAPEIRWGIVGVFGVLLTFVGFLGSVMVMDQFSMRYLAAATLLLPFALVPFARKLPMWVLLSLLGMHLQATAISGWVSFTPYVAGALPVRSTIGSGAAETKLVAFLQEQEVDVAEADYWASYRLSFLAQERIVVVPTNATEDRYPPHRIRFLDATKVAYIHDAFRSRESVDTARKTARERGTVTRETALDTGPFTVFVIEAAR